MQKLALVLFTALLLCQCESDNSVREEARAAATAMATEPATAPTTAPQATTKSIVPPRIAPGQTPPTVAATLTLAMGESRVKQGASTCLTVQATGFTDLIGFQFSIRWEVDELTFERIDKLQMPHLSPSNFGLTRTDQGVIAMSWINPSLTATSLAHQAPLFDVCFSASGPVGTAAKVNFASRPTAFEVINVEEDILQFKGTAGTIIVE